jgi:UDP-N-acetylglucosamine 2-epimerase (non-hydrolysing)
VKKSKRYFVAFGTRPEAIKLSPLIHELIALVGRKNVFICNTGQHRDLVRSVLDDFHIQEDCNLELMQVNQTPSTFLTSALPGLEKKIKLFNPDFVIVQGDTTSSLAAAMAAKFNQIRVAHVEAGLRTHDWRNPFPEELNRELIGRLSDVHFAATASGMQNLIAEGVKKEKVHVTGNTAIDSLFYISTAIGDAKPESIVNDLKFIREFRNQDLDLKKNHEFALVTLHRRESFGVDIEEALRAIRTLANKYQELTFLLPAHPNPNVRAAIKRIFEEEPEDSRNVMICEPLSYKTMVAVLKNCALVVTDSGGIQEEAPALGVPVVVARFATERSESIALNLAYLAGPNYENIVRISSAILDNGTLRAEFKKNKVSPYGDGHASRRIAKILQEPFDYTE